MKKRIATGFVVLFVTACGSSHSEPAKAIAQTPDRHEKNDCSDLLAQRDQIVADLNDGVDEIQHEGDVDSVPPSPIELSNIKANAEAWVQAYDTHRCDQVAPAAQSSVAVKKGIQEVGDYLDR